MKELSTTQIELLKKPLPKEAVTKHPTKTYLSSIKAIYVVERLNDVFGIGKWQLKSTVIDAKEKMVIVQTFLSIPEYSIELESYGGNDNADKGDAYKGATTDALTKICSMLGIGMDVFKGLADAPKQEVKKEVKPYLNEDSEAFTKAKAYMQQGHSITEIEKKYNISDAVRKLLVS